MGSRTYFDCAEDDYRGFLKNYEINNIYNSLGSMAQNICEKYMKHVIEECYQSTTQDEIKRKTTILRTHSLASLLHFLEFDMKVEYPTDCADAMDLIDGWYITTKYPGEDAVELDESDIEDCVKAIKACRAATINVCKSQDISFSLLLPEKQTEDSKEEPNKRLEPENISTDDENTSINNEGKSEKSEVSV